MKAILVIDMPDDLDISLDEIKANITVSSKDVRKSMLYLKYKDCQLRPLSQKKTVKNPIWADRSYDDFDKGYNACIDEITGETDKEKPDEDIIRKWERYCACGAKMMPNTAGGWYCPVCHRTMKSILVKRVG